MTTDDAIRWLDWHARECRDRDMAEALCLLLPAMMKVFRLERMDDLEERAIRHLFKGEIRAAVERERTERAEFRERMMIGVAD